MRAEDCNWIERHVEGLKAKKVMNSPIGHRSCANHEVRTSHEGYIGYEGCAGHKSCADHKSRVSQQNYKEWED